MAFHLKGLELLVEEQPKLAATLLFVMILVSVVALVLTSVFYVTCKVIERRLVNQMRRTHEAEQRSRSKSIALANAIDGIRQVLDGLIDLLPRGSDKSSLMQGCADDVKGLLDHIQNICKIEAGVSKPEVEEFNLAHTLEEVADDYQEEMIEKEEGVEVVLDPCDGSVSMFGNVRGDRFKLELIIRSLMINAVKYTPRGSISIRAWAKRHQPTTSILVDTNRHYWLNWLTRTFFFFFLIKDEEDYNKVGMEEDFSAHQRPTCMEYIFEVDDTGTGIPIDEQKSVFENFVLVDDPGFRLGLHAIRSLVRSMGGDIGIVTRKNLAPVSSSTSISKQQHQLMKTCKWQILKLMDRRPWWCY